MNAYYVSKERLEELQKELEYLKRTRRAEVAERLKKAKEYGDLSENSEYTEAKDEQALVETRIFELEGMLKSAVIIQKAKQKETVEIGSTITISQNGAERRYIIVGSSEARPEEGKISNESPIGREFLGKKVGDIAAIETPRGIVEYKLLKIE
ncbi:MAG: transcription elongation factor GreA [Candidatus Liptonbacteria bacterium]|nr:transcription elongation factor GreA [Candidatus Liptonbacteria bacterium]